MLYPDKFQAACNIKNNVNLRYLIQIPLTQEPNKHKSQVKLGVLNARSVRNKDVLIKDYLTDSNIDICVISETWLQDYDDYWIKACELNRDGYSMVTSRRIGRPGGGWLLFATTDSKLSNSTAELKDYLSMHYGIYW